MICCYLFIFIYNLLLSKQKWYYSNHNKLVSGYNKIVKKRDNVSFTKFEKTKKEKKIKPFLKKSKRLEKPNLKSITLK